MMEMPNVKKENIRPVSELRSYNRLLEDVKPDNPVILTKNGYGKYGIADLDEFSKYQRMAAASKLMQMVEEARQGKEYALEDVKKEILGE